MNIDQYRAMKAQDESAKAQPNVVEEPEVVQPIIEPTIEPTPVVEEVVKPITVEIDGKQVDIDELKNGYLRQADYTKKTQTLSNQKKEAEEAIAFYDYLKANPQVTQQLKTNTTVPKAIDPVTSKVVELETKMYDMMLEREIETLSNKYKDFEVREVLAMASKKGITDLEDAYLLVKSTKPNATPETLKEELRREILEEMKNEKVSTQSIITAGADVVPVTNNEPTLTEGEARVAKMMRLDAAEYIKWRDVDTKK